MARSSQEQLVLVLSTVPDAATGEGLARTLVEERLIACANLVPGLVSVYRWQGELHRDAEVLVLMKTRRSLLDRLTARVKELHPYDVPEVVSAPVEHALPAYLRWVLDETDAGDAEQRGSSPASDQGG